MFTGRFSIIGEVTIDDESLCGAFIECDAETLRKHRDLFCSQVLISPAPKAESAITIPQQLKPKMGANTLDLEIVDAPTSGV